MKTVSMYVCEKCEKEYKEKDSAILCEKSHIEPDKIIDAYYSPHEEYPESIKVTFKGSNEVVTYYIESYED